MKKILVFGNSGAGKSTLSKKLSSSYDLAHLDLDTVAFKKDFPMQRLELHSSMLEINEFIDKHDSWVIEGCYADLLEQLLEQANEMFFLDLPVEACQLNARKRKWEPHKYETKEAQDNNLDMLLNWILDYYSRDDESSHYAHQKIFEVFTGKKTRLITN